jgi:hypothetical protein
MSRVTRLNEKEPTLEFDLASRLLQNKGIARAVIAFMGYRLISEEITDYRQLIVLFAGEVSSGEEPAKARITLPDFDILLSETTALEA